MGGHFARFYPKRHTSVHKDDNKMTQGWISLYRQLGEHWLYPTEEKRKFTRYEAWLDLLLTVAHKEFKHTLQGVLTTIPRGCTVTSEVQLASRWKWHRSTVKRFLKLLTDEGMITLNKINENHRKSCTMLKITKYALYQDNNRANCTNDCTYEHTSNGTSQRATNHTQNNNDNNVNNDNKNSKFQKKFKQESFLNYAN